MLAVTGFGSSIITELAKMAPQEDIVRMQPPLYSGFSHADRYLLCAGLVRPKTIREQTEEEISAGLNVNLVWPVKLCERLLEENSRARICVIGSESGTYWSHDDIYAAGKAALHRYVETKKLQPGQQLVGIAPSTIGDSGMTRARADRKNLKAREKNHPKGRFLKAVEVARLVHFLLYIDSGYITGTVIPMDGGRR